MTLEIRRGKLPSELIAVIQAEYNEEKGTAVIEISHIVDVHILEPYVDQYCCDKPQHDVETDRYFEAKDVRRCDAGNFAPRLEGTLLGQDGSADFVLYY